MKVRMVAVVMLLVGTTLRNVQPVQASIEPIRIADTFFSALSAGDRSIAITMFAPNAVATLTRQEAYRGTAEIAQMMALMDHPGRQYASVRAVMIGDSVTVDIDVSDHGILWATETIIVEVRNGRIQAFRETALKLKLDAR